MNHPSSDWKDEDTWNLKTEMTRFLDRDIRFSGLLDAEDHRRCFIWENLRTRLFLGHEFNQENIEQMFPFYIKTFPEKPYKSHAPKQRVGWLEMKNANTHNWEDDLLTPSLGTIEQVDLGFYKGKLPSAKVDVTLYINPHWPKQKLLKLVERQSDAIFGMLDSNKQALERKGYEFPEKKKTRPKSYWQKLLKALGHYRLAECVDLKESYVLDAYGKGAYSEEKVYRREIRKLLPFLPCSWIVS